MLATGSSMVKTLQQMREGNPSEIHIVTAIACTVGIEYVRGPYSVKSGAVPSMRTDSQGIYRARLGMQVTSFGNKTRL
jgi:hypothetical protein